MVERRPGVIPPRPGPPPPRRPSTRRLFARRAFAVVLVVLALGGLGWVAVAAIGGGTKEPVAPAPPTTSSTLVYRTVTTTNSDGDETTTVIAMPKPFHVLFPEGFTRRQMAARVAAVARIARRERHVTPRLASRTYLAATSRTRRPPCFRGTSHGLEGFLFPATYEFFPNTTSGQLVDDQLAAFCDNWRRLNLAYARKRHLTQYDVLIIASMIEKETLSPDERQLVSAVIYNRLRVRMALQIDATLRYGLGIPPTESIHQSQLDSDSPYNTRKHTGLPPTPIANPGLASLQAAAHPAKVNYLYFVRKPDKKHHFFTASYDAFQRYAAAHGYGGP